MSFTNNASNLTGKSTTNAFNVIADSLTVNKNTLCKGDLTVLGTTNIGNVSLENGFVNNLTVNNFTATNPVPISSGGTGLATIGAPNQVLTVNSGGTGLIYQAPGLINPVTVTGTGFTGNPTLSFGLEADTGSLGRGFIRTGIAAVSGLCLGTASATVFRLWSNFSTDSNAEIINTNANFTYNSTGSSGVFQVLNAGGGISFTNSGIGTISLATSAGTISMSAGAGAISLTTGVGATSITTGAGPINLTTGTGNISLTTAAAGIISITTAIAGAVNVGAVGLGAVNVFGSVITLAAPVIYIGTAISPPIPSILTFACGAINGFTGAWDLTTLAFQLNALSISLNSTSTIALNNNTTVTGDLNSLSSSVFTTTNTNSTPQFIGSFLAPNISVNNSSFLGIGQSLTSGKSAFLQFQNSTIANSTYSLYGSSTSINQIYNGNITLTAPVTVVNGTLDVINGNIFTNQNIIGGISIINSGNLALTAASPGYILIRGGSGSIITLPDATTLIVGYTYTINNNSNFAATVNRHVSGLVGSVPSLSAATVVCIQTSSANGQWDIHITGPSTGTDWATPGQIGSAVPNTAAFTTLTTSSTTDIGGSFRAFGPIIPAPIPSGVNIGIDSGGFASIQLNGTGVTGGYIDFSTSGIDFYTRILGNTSREIQYLADTHTFRNTDDNTTFLKLNNIFTANIFGTAGISSQLFANSSNNASTTALNPGVTVYNSDGFKYGMDIGYNPTSARFRTRIFCPTTGGGDISLSTNPQNSTLQSEFTDRLIVRGDTGNVEIVCPDMSISGISTNILGALNVTGTSTSLGDAGCLKVINSSTVISSTLASFLQPTLGNIDVLQEDLNLTFGKSNTTNNSAQLQFGYTSASPPFSNPFTAWGFYGLSGTYIQLRQNPSAFQDKVLIKGNTRIDGDLKINGAVAVKNSSSFYYNTANFVVPANVWTDAKNILIVRSSGLNTLSAIIGGFRNDTGYTLQVSVSFSCQQVTAGFTSLRIAYDLDSQPIAQQDIESSNPQYINVSANFNLEPGSRIRCLIREILFPATFQGVLITINTTPIF